MPVLLSSSQVLEVEVISFVRSIQVGAVTSLQDALACKSKLRENVLKCLYQDHFKYFAVREPSKSMDPLCLHPSM